MTSDLEDDEIGLHYFALLSHDVFAEIAFHPGMHGLLSILEQLWILQFTCTQYIMVRSSNVDQSTTKNSPLQMDSCLHLQ